MSWHRHEWIVTGVVHVTDTWGGVEAGRHTELRCICDRCGKPKVKKLKGQFWTIEEVRKVRL